MTAAYWEVGRRIVEFEQGGEGRAGYGEALIKRLGEDLSRRFGRGFGWRNLSQMRAFYLTWPAEQILQTLSAKSPPHAIVPTPSAISPANEASAARAHSFLSLATLAQAFPLPWSAYVRLLSLKNPNARSFYEAEALRGGWSVRELERQIGSQFYERIALSHNKAEMLEKAEKPRLEGMLTSEQSVKDAFVLGFPGRQRRLRIDDTWFRVALAPQLSSFTNSTARGHSPYPEAGLRWPTAPTSTIRLPHALASRVTSSIRARGSFVLAATMLGNGSRVRGVGSQPF